MDDELSNQPDEQNEPTDQPEAPSPSPSSSSGKVISLIDLMADETQEKPPETTAPPDEPTATIPPPLVRSADDEETGTIAPMPATPTPAKPPLPLFSEELQPTPRPPERDEHATTVQPDVAFPAHTKVDLSKPERVDDSRQPPVRRQTAEKKGQAPQQRRQPPTPRHPNPPPPHQPTRRQSPPPRRPPTPAPTPARKVVIPAQGEKSVSHKVMQPRRSRLGCLFRGVIITGLLAVIGVALGILVLSIGYITIARQLPPPSELRSRSSKFETAIIYDNAGNQLWSLTDPNAGNRTYVTIDQISPDLINATIAIEDARFYSNPGFDPIGIGRAVFQAYQEGEIVGGASTITQQLARALLLDAEERAEISFSRKIKEIVLAAEMTRTYPGREGKNQLLELYLNEINYGNRAYGIEAASQTYFNKTANELNLAEASLLAGLPQAPAAWDPITRPDLAFNRQLQVLQQMEAEGYITREQLLQALDETNQFIYDLKLPEGSIEHPHFTLLALQELEDKFGPEAIYQGGLRIHTTLNSAVQQQAIATLTSHTTSIANAGANNGAIVASDPTTGKILALVGSLDFDDEAISGQINMALQPRQPGSTIKPLVFLSAMQRGWTPATLIWDVETAFPDGANPTQYVPKNYDNEFHGPLRLRPALGNSYNIPAIKALEYVGVCDFIADTQLLGLSLVDEGCSDVGLPRDTGLSLAVGGKAVSPLEMVTAFGVLANGGRLMPATAIERIENKSGEILYSADSVNAGNQVIRADHAYLLTSILSDNNARQPEFGLNNLLVIPGQQVAAKTGTTGSTENDVRDVWTIGYTSNLAVGVWVGNTDNQVLTQRASGYGVASPIWHDFMVATLANRPAQSFVQPPGVTNVEICADSGTVPGAGCSNRTTELFASDQPPLPAEQDFVKRLPINLWTGRIANDNCPDNNFEAGFVSPLVSGTEGVLPREQALATAWLSDTREGRAWAAERNIALPLQPPPTVQCDQNTAKPLAIIASPGAGAQVTSDGNLTIAGTARAPGFAGYRLEVGLGQSPSSWTPIVEWSNTQVDNGILANWRPEGMPAGEMTLRLLLYGPDNWFTPERDLIVKETRQTFTLIAPTGTPIRTPTHTPTSTATPLATETTNPTPIITPSATSAPVETVAPTDIPPTDAPTITPTQGVILVTVPPPSATPE